MYTCVAYSDRLHNIDRCILPYDRQYDICLTLQVALHSFSLSLSRAHSLFLAVTHTHLRQRQIDRKYNRQIDEGKLLALILSKYQPNFPPVAFSVVVVVVDAYASR